MNANWSELDKIFAGRILWTNSGKKKNILKMITLIALLAGAWFLLDWLISDK